MITLSLSLLLKSRHNGLKRCLLSESKRILLRSLKKWKKANDYKRSSQSLLKRTILRALHRKLRIGFDS